MTIEIKTTDWRNSDRYTSTKIADCEVTITASAIAKYLYPLMMRVNPGSVLGKKIANWFWDYEHVFGLELRTALAKPAKVSGKPSQKCKRRYGKALKGFAWDKLCTIIQELANNARPTALDKNAGIIAGMLDLDEIDQKIFTFVVMTDGDNQFECLVEEIVRTRYLDAPAVIAVMTGLDRSLVLDRLCRGELSRLELVDGFEEKPGYYELYVPWRVMDAVQHPVNDHAQIERILMGTPEKTDLQWSDYNHIRKERDFSLKLLRGALAHGQRGVNILLYGEPGLGKTELAKTLSEKGGFDLFSVGQETSSGDEPDRSARLSALKVVDRLGRRRGNCVLLFDEMEDILEGSTQYSGRKRSRRAGSKVHFNRLLETNQSPIIWTANDLSEFDTAFLRRMSFAIELKTPPKAVRAKQWKTLASREGISLNNERITALASAHKCAPSFAHTALKAVKSANGRAEEIDFVIKALSKACYGSEPPQERASSHAFDVSLLNPDIDVAAIKTRLSAAGSPRDVSFCFYGPPGTGKTAFATYLGETMDLEILEKRGSDLLSKWVGESEKLIAEAFEEAADEKKMLVIDEAESFFWNREGAGRSWEVSMVNEFLVCLERCPIPVVCTTNHLERMDPAAMRRFTFKIKLDYLQAEQVVRAYETYFGAPSPQLLTSGKLERCKMLTPGDFAVVKKQLRFHPGKVSPDEIVKRLQDEAAVKQLGKGKIGF